MNKELNEETEELGAATITCQIQKRLISSIKYDMKRLSRESYPDEKFIQMRNLPFIIESRVWL